VIFPLLDPAKALEATTHAPTKQVAFLKNSTFMFNTLTRFNREVLLLHNYRRQNLPYGMSIRVDLVQLGVAALKAGFLKVKAT
jgi:hypothetical protein